ncbi:MAG: hypothetical protein AAF664_16825 [Planctomycetota bacterium]
MGNILNATENWRVTAGEKAGEVAALRRFGRGGVYRAFSYSFVAVIIVLIGFVGQWLFAVDDLFVDSLLPAIICLLLFGSTRKREFDRVAKISIDLFILMDDHRLMINGQEVSIPANATCEFWYKVFPSDDGDPDSSFARLEFVVEHEGKRTGYPLISNVDTRAIKLANELSKLTSFELQYTTVKQLQR